MRACAVILTLLLVAGCTTPAPSGTPPPSPSATGKASPTATATPYPSPSPFPDPHPGLTLFLLIEDTLTTNRTVRGDFFGWCTPAHYGRDPPALEFFGTTPPRWVIVRQYAPPWRGDHEGQNWTREDYAAPGTIEVNATLRPTMPLLSIRFDGESVDVNGTRLPPGAWLDARASYEASPWDGYGYERAPLQAQEELRVWNLGFVEAAQAEPRMCL
jgi:hypothetical protein